MRNALIKRFHQQARFAQDYSPLYALLFGVAAGWLEEGDPAGEWLIAASNGRSPFDVTLLLAAGVHRDALAGVEAARPLANYYPTANGSLPPEPAPFAQALRQAIWERRETLAAFIQSAAVQTNETARGLVWLWPLLHLPWEAAHLVDLGASAGLNLAADRRSYQLLDENGRLQRQIGQGKPIQFQTICQGDDPGAGDGRIPHILSRAGCDLSPFPLQTAEDELTLASFVWGDQPIRLERLREGIAAFKTVERDTAVCLRPVNLPRELPRFLRDHIPAAPAAPVVIYNTYMTAYLENKGKALRRIIGEWAAGQNRPVLWLQWEPLWGGPSPPEFGWCAWTADLWEGNNHRRRQLAWIHPHGARLRWLETGDW